MSQKRVARRSTSKKSKRDEVVEQLWASADYRPTRDSSEIKAKTEAQGHYILAIKSKTLTIGAGPAGTGKTWIAAAMAAQMIMDKQVERLIITRPAVEAVEELGFLPGEIDQKFAPYFEPFRDVLEERLGEGHVTGLMKGKRIVAAPLAYIRGKSWKDAVVVLDEAQNTTPAQMKLLLTRIGENCKVIVNGDSSQSDIRGRNGLDDLIERVQAFHIPDARVVKFERADIVRSGFVRHIIEAYETPL